MANSVEQECAQAVRFMTESPGWEIVGGHIQDRIHAAKEQLMHCKLEEVVEHRARAEALQEVLVFIQETLEDGGE